MNAAKPSSVRTLELLRQYPQKAGVSVRAYVERAIGERAHEVIAEAQPLARDVSLQSISLDGHDVDSVSFGLTYDAVVGSENVRYKVPYALSGAALAGLEASLSNVPVYAALDAFHGACGASHVDLARCRFDLLRPGRLGRARGNVLDHIGETAVDERRLHFRFEQRVPTNDIGFLAGRQVLHVFVERDGALVQREARTTMMS